MSDQSGAIVWTAEYRAWASEEKQSTALREAQDESYARIVNLKTHLKRDIWDSKIITNNIRFQGDEQRASTTQSEAQVKGNGTSL